MVYVAAAAAVVMILAGGSWLVRASGTAPGSADQGADGREPHWEVLPRTFPVDRGWLSGPSLIIPGETECFVAFGQDNTGTAVRAGYWRSTDDCRTAENVTPAHRPIGDALASFDRGSIVAAVPAREGGYLLVHRHQFDGDAFAYFSRILHGDPSAPATDPAPAEGAWQELARFVTDTPQASHAGPRALVATDSGYVAVGRVDETLLAWTSVDGTDWLPVPLPVAGLGERPNVVRLVLGPEGTLVAVGTGGTSAASDQLAGWFSTDGGASWSQTEMPDGGERPQLTTLLHTGREYVALGGQTNSVLSPALVLASPDGVVWTRDDSLADAGGSYVASATALPHGEVLAISRPDEASGTRTDEASTRPDEACAVAWVSTATGWSEEPLGCHGVPNSLAVLADGTVAGVHWSTLFLRAPTTSILD